MGNPVSEYEGNCYKKMKTPIQKWEHFFKPEVRSSGRVLLTQGKVFISQPSDTEVVINIQTSSHTKVSLKTKSVSSPTLYVDCNCSAGKKDLFCKHIWAGLLITEQKNPDFFESKTEIEKTKPTAQSQDREERKTALKEKQKSYRKEQYQKKKQRLKSFKKNKKDLPLKNEFPSEVENALDFFSKNGFELRDSLSKDLVGGAKKKLARIFHPDLGGSHDEILNLNKYSDILLNFLKRS